MKRSPMIRTGILSQSSFQRLAMVEPKRRMRKCKLKSCRQAFEPRSMTHVACSPEHALEIVALDRAAKDKRERQQGLQKLKRRADYMRDAQAALNAWIRNVRDRDLPCISCGRFHQGQYHAGHFLARGSHPHLALLEINLAKQCQPCNVHLSGNQLAFRRGLIERVGISAVEALETDQVPRKYSIDQLKEITAEYRTKVRKASL